MSMGETVVDSLTLFFVEMIPVTQNHSTLPGPSTSHGVEFLVLTRSSFFLSQEKKVLEDIHVHSRFSELYLWVIQRELYYKIKSRAVHAQIYGNALVSHCLSLN